MFEMDDHTFFDDKSENFNFFIVLKLTVKSRLLQFIIGPVVERGEFPEILVPDR
jgi:hypothetical protein